MRQLVLAPLKRVAARDPRRGVRLAQAMADVTRPLRFGVDDATLAELFPELDARARAAARHATWSTYLRNEALEAALDDRLGPPRYPELVDPPAPEELAGPCVIVSFHVGPVWIFGALLAQVENEVFALSRDGGVDRGVTLLRSGDDPATRASTFLRTVREVRRGAGVFALADAGQRGIWDLAWIYAPLLGRRLTMARGPFALARIAGVPLVPLAARWHGDGVAFVKGEPITADDDDEVTAAALTRWLEDYLRAFPGETAAYLLERLTPQRSGAAAP